MNPQPRTGIPASSRLIAAVLLALHSTGIYAQDAHVHGLAQLNVAVLGQTLQAEFLSPAVNLLGFEYSPATVEELTTYAETEAQLRSSNWLFGKMLASCAMELVDLEFPVFTSTQEAEEAHDHDHGDHEHEDHDHEHGSASEHGDYRVEYLFECSGTGLPNITALDVTAFAAFSGLESITVQWVTRSNQGFAELTPDNTSIQLK